MNILLADDTKTERFFLNSLLQSLGFKADIANGGKDAIKMSTGKKYDIIFLDTDMPEPDGQKTCQRIRSIKDNPNLETPVIYMGQIASEDTHQNTYVLPKPITTPVLSETINSLIPGSIEMQADGTENATETTADEAQTFADIMAAIPDVNVDDGIMHCGSEEGYLAALEIFYSTISQKADEIQDYYDNDDFESYTIKVHALKSSARIIGASRLADDAYALEMAGKENDIDTIRQKTDALLVNYKDFLTYLAPLFSDGSLGDDDSSTDEKEPDVPLDVLNDAYKSLYDFAEAMDYDLLEMVLKSLDEYILPKEDAKRVANIRTKLLNLDYEGIQDILGDNIK